MLTEDRELVQRWILRFSLGIALFVGLLSWLNDVSLVNIIIRLGIAYGIMYFLLAGVFSLFEKTGMPELESDLQGTKSDSESERGVLLDVAVGEEEIRNPEGQDPGFPGQVDQDLRTGLQDSEQQAEIVRRMGWG